MSGGGARLGRVVADDDGVEDREDLVAGHADAPSVLADSGSRAWWMQNEPYAAQIAIDRVEKGDGSGGRVRSGVTRSLQAHASGVVDVGRTNWPMPKPGT
jgi:hypothetical protein